MTETDFERHKRATEKNLRNRQEAFDECLSRSISPATACRVWTHLKPEDFDNLLGIEVAGEMRYSAWQFAANGLRPDLGKIMKYLNEFAPDDPIAADQIMYERHDDLGGTSMTFALESRDFAVQAPAFIRLQSLGD